MEEWGNFSHCPDNSSGENDSCYYTVTGRSAVKKADKYDSEWAQQANITITNNITIPIAALGVALNCLVLLAWRRKMSSLVLMFRSLAVADIIFVVAFSVWFQLPHDTRVDLIFQWIAFTGRFVVVNITFFMSLLRYAAVVFPYSFQARLNECHLRLALAVIIVYCSIAQLIVQLTNMYTGAGKVVEVTVDQICMSLPLVVQLLLSMHMLRKMNLFSLRNSLEEQQIRETRSLSQTSVGEGAVIGISKKSRRSSRQLTAIVITITLVTFVCYPVAVTFTTYFKLTPTPPKTSIKLAVNAFLNLMTVFNSSFNFVIYWCLMPAFRNSLRRLLLCCPNVSESEATATSLLHRSSLLSRRGSGPENLDKTATASDLKNDPAVRRHSDGGRKTFTFSLPPNSSVNKSGTSDSESSSPAPQSSKEKSGISDVESSSPAPQSSKEKSGISDVESSLPAPQSSKGKAGISDVESNSGVPLSTLDEARTFNLKHFPHYIAQFSGRCSVQSDSSLSFTGTTSDFADNSSSFSDESLSSTATVTNK